MKRKLYSEACYFLGVFLLAFGTSLFDKANFGMSTVIAPAYLLHLGLSPLLPFFSFGMASYTFQALILLPLTILAGKRFRLSYLYSFLTAVFYGFVLDGCVLLSSLIPGGDILALRILFYAVGLALSALGVALLFRTYFSLELYDTLVLVIARRFSFDTGRVKTVYDCLSFTLAVILSFSFFGFLTFRGIGIGSVICALLNGPLISLFSRLLDRYFEFPDRFPLKRYFS